MLMLVLFLLCLLLDFWIATAPEAFRDSRSARNGCHGYLWSLSYWQLSLGTEA